MPEPFFTFESLDLLIVLGTALLLVVGMALLVLRRRNEILKTYLTTKEEDIEEQFFRRRPSKPVEEVGEPAEAAEESLEEEVSSEWGTPSIDAT